MLLRLATVVDVAGMHRVRLRVRENVLRNPDRITEQMYRDHLELLGRGWVAELHGQIVGFAIADRVSHSVWALFVDPDHERRGIGRQLHDAMLAWFREQGVATVKLSTAADTRAAAFYRAAGWQAVGHDANGEILFERQST